MRVCLGGTFHPFHVGHEALLRRAFEGDEVFVGVTTGELAGRAERTIPDWKVRAEAVEAFAKAAGFQGKLMVRALTDGVGPAATEAYDAIVVSPETVAGAARINQQRTDAGLPPLQVWDVPHVRGADRLPISATAIAAGRIDRDGTRLTPIDVAVGSANPVKVAGAQAAFNTFLPDAAVQGISVPSGVPEQPQGGETLAGARARAVAALDMTGADYAVGIEAGLNQDDEGAWYDVQACVVLDRTGHETVGWGPAFSYPEWVLDRARKGEMISEILGPVADDPRIGGTTGAIGYLSDGAMDRTELTRAAVLMALVPRWRPDLYATTP